MKTFLVIFALLFTLLLTISCGTAKKIDAKNFDLIVLNSLNDAGAGFGHDTNKISIIFDETRFKTFDLKNKDDVAHDIVEELKKII